MKNIKTLVPVAVATFAIYLAGTSVPTKATTLYWNPTSASSAPLSYSNGTVSTSVSDFYTGSAASVWVNGDVMQIGSNSATTTKYNSPAGAFMLTLSGNIQTPQLLISSNLTSGNEVTIYDNGSNSNELTMANAGAGLQNESTSPLLINAQIVSSATNALAVSGTGTTIFEENNTGITDGVLIESATGAAGVGGVLQIGNGGTTGSLGTGTVTISTIASQTTASALSYDLSAATTVGNTIVINSTTGGGPSNLGGIIRQAGSSTLAFTSGISNSTTGATTFDIGGAAGTTDTSVSGTISGTGSLTKMGTGLLALSGASNSYSGGTSVKAGILMANSSTGSLGTGAVSVSSGGTLGGSGLIAPSAVNSGAAVDIASGGILAPSNGAGANTLTLQLNTGATLNLESGSQFVFDLGTASDLVNMTGGTLNLNSQTFSNFTFNAESGFGLGTYTLIQTTTAITGTFSPSTGTVDGYNAQLAESGDNLVLNITTAPEPRAGIMLGCGLALLFTIRRVRLTR